MQVKRWLARHGKFSKLVNDPKESVIVEDSRDEEIDSRLKKWANQWERKHKLSDRVATM